MIRRTVMAALTCYSLVACVGEGHVRVYDGAPPGAARGGPPAAANGEPIVAQQAPAAAAPAPIGGPVDGRGGERRDDARDKKVEAATGWEKLGERTVDGKMDHDTIHVGRAEGRFSAIQLKVEHSALELFDVVVTFGDNTSFSPTTRLVFANGQTSRVIDLPGDKRVIRKVDFKYGNLPGGGRAQLELWGH